MPAISEYDLPSSWFAKMKFFLTELNNYMLSPPSCLKIDLTMYGIDYKSKLAIKLFKIT